MKTFSQTNTLDGKPDNNCCNDKIKAAIIYNVVEQNYIVPRDLLLEKLPESIVNPFLEFLTSLNLDQAQLSAFLEMLKNGEVTIACRED